MKGNAIDKISVILCTYNPNDHLQQQLDSIADSIGKNLKVSLSIFDDSNPSGKLFDLIGLRFFDCTKVFQGARKGSACINFIYALEQVDADWVFFSDQDDIWEKSKVKDYLDIIGTVDNDTPQIIFSDASLIDEKGNKLFDSFYRYQGLSTNVLDSDDILFKNCVQGATLCINKRMIKLVRESLEGEDINCLAMHDWWIAILARYYGNWTYISKPLIKYRQHENNVIGAQKKSNVIVKFLRNPRIYYQRLMTLKNQYELWLKVSGKLKMASQFDAKNMKLSFLSKCKLIVIRYLM